MNQVNENHHYINGKWESGSGNTISILNKYTGQSIAEINYADKNQIRKAIEAALNSFEEYKAVNAGERQKWILNLVRLLKNKVDLFTKLIVAEAGKPVEYARTEVNRAIHTLEIAASEAVRIGGEFIAMDFESGAGKMAFTKRFPVGPVAAISPFNFPLNLAMHKIAPALACGCTVVLKPPPQSPLTCLTFAKLIDEAGIPPGIINIVLCDIPEAESLVKDERIKLLSFTGSDKVGWHLKNIAGKKKVVLELGGNAAVLIDEKTDLKIIAGIIAKGSFNYAGQVCISTQRIYVVEEIFDEFIKVFIKETENIKSGDPTDPEVVNGPIISEEHLNRIDNWLKEAVDNGATLLTGGKILSRENNLFAPTILTNTNHSMKIISEEVFGPVVAVERVKSFEYGLKQINNSRYGLQAGVFTNDIQKMKLAFNTLDVGSVIINNVPAFRIDSMPYGGIKDSGMGREGVKYAIEDMTELKLMVF